MIRFTPEFLENFLAVVRKYMQLRGGLTQKDLSEMMNVGISTMSRFLNLKTSSVDEQLVANIIATLGIPLHEIIDGVEEESTETFKRLVQFYKDQKTSDQNAGEEAPKAHETRKTSATINVGGKKQQMPFGEGSSVSNTRTDLTMKEKLETLSPRQKGYLNDFLNLDANDRDLIVDLGDAIFRYIRQRNMEF
ncbi:helix-turn-helix domain-containing protein [Peredibacter starrii]|uniref:Helix-turn-helix domain-containing protein n=1 Tax=Peredibacter starrii TaxID=28202 RepID=A0AAX4HPJ7_9BACT|nr:helix-turn-helix domain-containing protein [Peredibacter starrii]WPU65179.1 helix-turn-helix domain-containing protein [Peredibacter starrii]